MRRPPASSPRSASEMSDARDLLAQVIGRALAADIDPDASLRGSGVGSGELIRLSLLVEDHLDRPLTEEELFTVQSLAALQRLMDGEAQS